MPGSWVLPSREELEQGQGCGIPCQKALPGADRPGEIREGAGAAGRSRFRSEQGNPLHTCLRSGRLRKEEPFPINGSAEWKLFTKPSCTKCDHVREELRAGHVSTRCTISRNQGPEALQPVLRQIREHLTRNTKARWTCHPAPGREGRPGCWLGIRSPGDPPDAHQREGMPSLLTSQVLTVQDWAGS